MKEKVGPLSSEAFSERCRNAQMVVLDIAQGEPQGKHLDSAGGRVQVQTSASLLPAVWP